MAAVNQPKPPRPHAFEYTASLSHMVKLFGSESAVRAEYKRVRDIMHKRVQRVAAAGELNPGTALYRYRNGIPTASGRETKDLLKDLGRMVRTMEYQQTGSLAGIREMQASQKRNRDYMLKGLIETGVIGKPVTESTKNQIIEDDDDEEDTGDLVTHKSTAEVEAEYNAMTEKEKAQINQTIWAAVDLLRSAGIEDAQYLIHTGNGAGIGNFVVTDKGNPRTSARAVVRDFIRSNLGREGMSAYNRGTRTGDYGNFAEMVGELYD